MPRVLRSPGQFGFGRSLSGEFRVWFRTSTGVHRNSPARIQYGYLSITMPITIINNVLLNIGRNAHSSIIIIINGGCGGVERYARETRWKFSKLGYITLPKALDITRLEFAAWRIPVDYYNCNLNRFCGARVAVEGEEEEGEEGKRPRKKHTHIQHLWKYFTAIRV